MCDCHCDGTVVGEGGVVVVVFVGIEPVSDGRNYDCIPPPMHRLPRGTKDNVHMYASYLPVEVT